MKFDCKYAFGEMVDFTFGNDTITGTIQGISFWPDTDAPKYSIERFEGKKWTEDYYDIFESSILTAPSKGSDHA